MIKNARPMYWDKIERGLKKITNLPGPVHNLINNRDRLVFHQSVPPEADSNAKAYVSTGDMDENGNIDTVNIVVTNLEKEWPQDILGKINSMDDNDPVFQQILTGIAKTLIHELAHIDDHKEGAFPGGEGVAETAEKAFDPTFASSTIKSNIKEGRKKISSNGEYKMKESLIKLANHLDRIGHSDLADKLDFIVKSSAQLNEAAIEKSASDASVEENKSVEVDDASERIKKMANLISGEFSNFGRSVSR